jgi:cold-inducible RNA-binding protein
LIVGKKLYVGNLNSDATGTFLSELFTPYGTVESARIAIDRETGSSKGFGIVEMKAEQEAVAATAALNGTESGGRRLKVREARLRPKAT